MNDGYTVDQLRTDYGDVQRFLKSEIAIREALALSRSWERKRWINKAAAARAALDALGRLGDYVASTDPEARLPSGIRQPGLFE